MQPTLTWALFGWAFCSMLAAPPLSAEEPGRAAETVAGTDDRTPDGSEPRDSGDAEVALEDLSGIGTEEIAWLDRKAEAVDRVYGQIRRQNPREFQAWPEIKIMSCDSFNAFATPDGWISICASALDQVRTDDELAFIIGHELGHLHFRHSRVDVRAINLKGVAARIRVGGRGASLGAAGAVALGLVARISANQDDGFEDSYDEDVTQFEKLLVSAGSTLPDPLQNPAPYLAMLGLSALSFAAGEYGAISVTQSANATLRVRRPRQEIQADQYAIRLMASSGYQPDMALSVLNKINTSGVISTAELTGTSAVQLQLETRGLNGYPDPNKRAELLSAEIAVSTKWLEAHPVSLALSDGAAPFQMTASQQALAALRSGAVAYSEAGAPAFVAACKEAAALMQPLPLAQDDVASVTRALIAQVCHGPSASAGEGSWYVARANAVLALMSGVDARGPLMQAASRSESVLQYVDILRIALWGGDRRTADDIARTCDLDTGKSACLVLLKSTKKEFYDFWNSIGGRRSSPLDPMSRAFLLQQVPELSYVAGDLPTPLDDLFWLGRMTRERPASSLAATGRVSPRLESILARLPSNVDPGDADPGEADIGYADPGVLDESAAAEREMDLPMKQYVVRPSGR
jgi:hypothetical protein